MAVTAAGTAYTPHTWTNVTGDPSIWAVADHLAATDYRKPVLLFCHGNGSDYNSFTVGGQYRRLRDALIDAGWVYIETLGGSVSHWGREFAMASYTAACREAAAMHPLGTVVAYGRSMGGTVSSSLALKDEWGLRPHVVGLCLESAVQSLYFRHVTRGKSLNGQYPEGRPDHGGDPQEFADASAPFDPLRFPVSLFADMPVQFIHGTADDNVLPEGHCLPQHARIKDIAPYADLHLRGLGTHGTGDSGDDEVFDPAWEFINTAQGLWPRPVSVSLGGAPMAASGTYYPRGWRQAVPLTP